MTRSRWLVNLLVLACLLAPFLALSAVAETEEERRDRIERMEQLKRTEEVTGGSSRLWSELSKKLAWYVDYGGTARLTYTGGHDNDRNHGTSDATAFSKDYELNAFFNMTDLPRTSKFYGRFRSTYTERKKNAGATRGNEWTQLAVDVLYFERTYKTKLSTTKFTLGRQFESVGRGIAYSAAGDGIHANVTYKRIDLTMFGVKADRSPDDADPGNLSPPSRGHTHRNFMGGQIKWSMHPRLSPYIFYVLNKDHGSHSPDPQTNETHIYEPKFIGYGTDGATFIPRLSYYAEFIRVYGTTTSAGGSKLDTTPVDASAYDVGLNYRFQSAYQPVISAEWAYGSGDPDRQTTVNSTLLGNRAGADQAFRPFGGANLGYALAPTLVNLNSHRYGASFKPFARSAHEKIQDIQMTVDWFVFRRDVTPGPISDLSAFADARAQKRIGKELNAQATWQVYNDLRLNVRWGKFDPDKDSYGQDLGGQTFRGADPEIYWRVQWSLDL